MANTPKKPMDHLTAKAELKNEDITVTFAEIDYVIPAGALDNVEILEYVEDEKYIKAIKEIVGLDQWEIFKDDTKAKNGGKVTVEVFQEFITLVFNSVGK